MVTTLATSNLNSSGSRYLAVKTWVEDRKNEVTDAIQTVEAEDRARGLYTLQSSPTSLLEYQTFSGNDSQCFFTFKENFLRCFKSNKVPHVDQPAKLRELQVTFFIDLEAKLQDILDLRAKGDHLGRLAYGQDVFNAIYNNLAVSQNLKLVAVPWDKYSREKLIKTKDKLTEFREAANMLDKTRVDSGEKKRVGGAAGKGSVSSGAGSGVGPEGGGHPSVQAAAANLNLPDCRICKSVDGPGITRLDRGVPFADPTNLYVTHHSKAFHGCPKFMEMTVWRRSKVCFDIKACSRCLDPAVHYDPAHNASCQVMMDSTANKKKSKYTCKVDKC